MVTLKLPAECKPRLLALAALTGETPSQWVSRSLRERVERRARGVVTLEIEAPTAIRITRLASALKMDLSDLVEKMVAELALRELSAMAS